MASRYDVDLKLQQSQAGLFSKFDMKSSEVDACLGGLRQVHFFFDILSSQNWELHAFPNGGDAGMTSTGTGVFAFRLGQPEGLGTMSTFLPSENMI
jgi:hypothetical protein